MVPFESCSLFSGLDAAELERLKSVVREISFAPGAVIFKQGDPGDGLYLVKSGRVQITAQLDPDNLCPISAIEEGGVFGEMAVLDSGPRSANATAETATQVYFISRKDLLERLGHSPLLGLSLMREISGRLREFTQQYTREVLHAERLALVGRFARTIVHDLKNPLAVISMAGDLACLPNATPETRLSARQRIRRQVERINDMVNELLDFTRGSQTSFILTLGDYAAFIQHLVTEVRPELALKKATIELEQPPPEVKVPLNPHRLTRALLNLLHNATDAMPEGGKIMLRFRVTDSEVITEVEDTGPGIAPEIADHLFEAFASYGKAHGTGLGLSICKRIIADHQGRISARNRPGGGAILAFTLPIHKPLDLPPASTAAPANP